MENTYLVIMSQLQATFEELDKYKATNKRLHVEVKTQKLMKELRDNENCRLRDQNRQLEKTKRDNEKMLSDKNNEISCLNVHNQNLKYPIRKSNNDEETPYISNHKLEEEIKRLKELIMDKDT